MMFDAVSTMAAYACADKLRRRAGLRVGNLAGAHGAGEAAAWAKQGAFPMPMSIGEFDKFLRDEIVKWAKAVKASGARADR